MTEPVPPSADEITVHRVKRYAWIALVVAVLLAIWGVASRVHSRSSLGKQTANEAVPVVISSHPEGSPASEELVLPGNVQAFIEAPIYARTSGYLRVWYTDIGTPVSKGQLLAEIDTPEVDQQLRQSRADLATARANAQLAQSTNTRWQGLLANHAVSQQDADTRAADAAATRASAASAEANEARLEQLETFKRVVAPFDGVVTGRNTDIGALINAGQSSGSWLFRVADTKKLRIYVDVPESYAARMTVGLQAQLHFNEHPGEDYPATLVRTAQALDPTLRTLQVELQVDNSEGELFPGAYAEVHFKLPGSSSTVRVPATALVFRAQGLQVATVTDGNHVHMKGILQGRDFGTSVEVLSGLTANDEIIVNPPDSLSEGSTVRTRPPPAQQGSAPKPAARAP
ncbi:MAG TPA: efflux RND transporter periplasmic adaptor subunit [Steroidobacteraceae bacterium]|nr:efflux RND transporter periplasmic adaptor subunit [Steroidobacteraceae bacterium]